MQLVRAGRESTGMHEDPHSKLVPRYSSSGRCPSWGGIRVQVNGSPLVSLKRCSIIL
jgi:hypothetical protein